MKKVKVVWFVLSLFMIAMLVVAGCAPGPTPEKPIEIVVAQYSPQTHMSSTWLTECWADELEKKTQGRVECVIYYSAALGGPTTYADMVEAGAVDAAMLPWAWYPARFPLLEVMNLPFAWPSGEVADKVYYDLYYKGYFENELAKFKLLYLGDGSPYNVMSVEPIHTPADMKGKKIRSGGGAWTPTIEAWGGVPVSLPTAELYPALERKLIDGTVIVASSAYGMKAYEVAKYITLTRVGSFGLGGCMNLDFYNGLPKDVQKAIDELFVERGESRSYGWWLDREDAKALDEFPKLGVTVYTPTPGEMALWKASAKGIIDNWIAEMEAKGKPAQKLVDDMVAIAAKYGANPY